MKKLLITIFVLLALTTFTYADQTCYVNEDCPFTTIVYNTTQSYFNGTVVNSLYQPNTSYYLDQEMIQGVINGDKITYNYNYTFNNSGYYTRESVANGRMMTEQITVKKYYSKFLWEDNEMIANIFEPFLLFLLGAILVYLGYKSDSNTGYFWTLAGGVFWLGSAGSMVFAGSMITAIYFVLLGFVAIFIGVAEIVKGE